MNRTFIFAFILLVTISTVYAIPFPRSLFQNSLLCPGNSSPFTLSYSPDPLVSGSSFTFDISGKLNVDIPTGALFGAGFFSNDGSIIASFSADFCASEGIQCPITAGTEFSTKVQRTAPENLPKSFVIGGAIIDQRGNSVIGCTLIVGEA